MQLQNWLCVVTRQAVELSRKDLLKKQVFAFERQQFLVRGKLPQPGTGG